MSSAGGLVKCSKIRQLVRLRQMLRRWRHKAAVSSRRVPSDVPAGHIAICVGETQRRFIVRASHLNHPVFKSMLRQAEEEYGGYEFCPSGPLSIPNVEESVFEEIVRFLNRSDSKKVSGSGGRFVNLEDFRCNRVGAIGICGEGRPLLSEKSVW